ncbi:hypothetical protein EK51_004437 [Salmonella enterica subsp. enterica]|nr:hypothetical protein [Salmonella enterica subsp. enterica]
MTQSEKWFTGLALVWFWLYGATAVRDLSMKVSCDSSSPGKTLKMQLMAGSGTLSWAGEQVLGTSVTGLGIRVTDSSG